MNRLGPPVYSIPPVTRREKINLLYYSRNFLFLHWFVRKTEEISMSDISKEQYKPKNKIRFVSAASLYDGHDAAINLYRRLLQDAGVEVIHLGHNRSVAEVVRAAIEEDVQGIAVSSYQGGHIEYFKYMYDLLREKGAGHIGIYGGGGGVIVPEEIKELENYGIRKIFSPEDGRKYGLEGIISRIVEGSDFDLAEQKVKGMDNPSPDNSLAIARLLTVAENKPAKLKAFLSREAKDVPVLGFTGTGGAGKSSLIDELIRRFYIHYPEKKIAVVALDPSRRKTGGALLGDRIRMNSVFFSNVYMRSMATRRSHMALSKMIHEALDVLKRSGFDLILVETSGIGQSDSEIVDVADVSVYVMTSDYGASSQLEKIDMLDYADVVVINKFDRRGSEDALRDVRKQYRRNHNLFHGVEDEDLPVFGTIASQFNDEGVNALFAELIMKLGARFTEQPLRVKDKIRMSVAHSKLIPDERQNYLGEISRAVRQYRKYVDEQTELMARKEALERLKDMVSGGELEEELRTAGKAIDEDALKLFEQYENLKNQYLGSEAVYTVRGKEIRTPAAVESLSHTRIPRVALPKYVSKADLLRFLLKENLPGYFPYAAGVFPFKRADEDPKRQFAGEGTPERTNRRFHYLSRNDDAKRLSVAFDSVTLYGEDPDERPDIYGKIGESGVSICTLDDMKKLFAGFDLVNPRTSVSMTINGPAPIMLAMFMNTAIEQQREKFIKSEGREPDAEEYRQIIDETLQNVRGTVQADILKEDQAQNTCIFSTDFALKMMGDIQEFFIEKKVRNYYSVSISGYHIAEAGANPITQLATTLANGFTYVEYYRARGMDVDRFAPNLSFFFSNGLDPEYSVLGRVARKIWAVAMKYYLGANERSQKLKYHIQTSGRSLHAQEVEFNDIRTTLQALLAIMDNCNSLHTNAYDEAITTPTEESVRRAMAIQLIINREFGLTKNENPLQGSFIIEELTDLVEEAVLKIFDEINRRGGVLGAMETQYQRMKIQEESLYYEMKKHHGDLPIVGVNTFLKDGQEPETYTGELSRATPEEKRAQLDNLRAFQKRNAKEAAKALAKLKEVAVSGENIFAELMNTVKYASLGQITGVLYEAGGKYRRNL